MQYRDNENRLKFNSIARWTPNSPCGFINIYWHSFQLWFLIITLLFVWHLLVLFNLCALVFFVFSSCLKEYQKQTLVLFLKTFWSLCILVQLLKEAIGAENGNGFRKKHQFLGELAGESIWVKYWQGEDILIICQPIFCIEECRWS